MIPTDFLFYAVSVPAVLLMAINKSGFGSGVGVMAVPLMALAMPPLQAAAIMLPILCVIDLFSVWAYRKIGTGLTCGFYCPARSWASYLEP